MQPDGATFLGSLPLVNRRSAARLAGECAMVAAVFAGLAVLLLPPLFRDVANTVLDPLRPWHAFADPAGGARAHAMLRHIHLLVWVYAWDWHALWTDPSSLFDANIFHPAPAALAYSEHGLGKVVLTGPLLAAIGNVVLAHQVDLLLCFALSGAAMYGVVRALGGLPAAALVAGFVYAFAPVRIDSLYHSHLLAGQWFPLALLFLDRALFDGRARDAAAFGALLLVQVLTSYYVAYQTAFALLAYATTTLWLTRARLPWRGITRVALATSFVGAAFAALSVPYCASARAARS